MPDPTYPLFPVVAFLAFVLGLVPLPWHLQAWNAGTCIFMLWASLSSFVKFVNAVIWNGNMENVAPVWCDIATKFLIGAGVGIPAASLCINRRLYHIASVRTVCVSQQDKRRQVIEDTAIGIGIPVLIMILHYVVQGHRFDIIEDIGCLPTTFWTPAAIPLAFMWPTLIGCVSFVYAALTLRAFWMRRVQFNEMLSSNSCLSASRYFRLMLLSIIEMSCTIPVSLFAVYIITNGVSMAPWKSWEDTHYNFSYVGKLPAAVWKSDPSRRISAELTLWLNPCSALLFFALFGFAEEARRQYCKAFNSVKTAIGWRTLKNYHAKPNFKNGFIRNGKGADFASTSTLPTQDYSPRKYNRANSLFSSVISFNDADFEKGLSSSTSTSSPIFSPSDTVIDCSEPASPTSTLHLNPFSPPSLSPPPISYYPSPSPPFRRPFSSSTILPLTANFPSSAGPMLEPPNTLPIAIHRESCHF